MQTFLYQEFNTSIFIWNIPHEKYVLIMLKNKQKSNLTDEVLPTLTHPSKFSVIGPFASRRPPT